MIDFAGDYEANLKILDTQIANRPRSASLLAQRAELRFDHEDYEGAIADYTAAIKLKRKKPNYWWYRGLAHLEMKMNLAAYNDLSIAHRLRPRWTKLIVDLGLCMERFDDHARAEEYYKQAIKINRKYNEPYIFLGSLRIEQHNFKEAVEYLDRAVKLNPVDSQARYYRGIALGHLLRHEESFEDFEMASILDPNDYHARYNKALSLFYTEKYKAAEEVIHQILKENPEDEIALDIMEMIEGETEGEGWKRGEE